MCGRTVSKYFRIQNLLLKYLFFVVLFNGAIIAQNINLSFSEKFTLSAATSWSRIITVNNKLMLWGLANDSLKVMPYGKFENTIAIIKKGVNIIQSSSGVYLQYTGIQQTIPDTILCYNSLSFKPTKVLINNVGINFNAEKLHENKISLSRLNISQGLPFVEIIDLNSKKTLVKMNSSDISKGPRVGQPVVLTTQNRIYVALDSEFKLMSYSHNGSFISEIIYPQYKKEPYSESEIRFLPAKVQRFVKEKIDFPKVIFRINELNEHYIVVTEFPRPGSSQIKNYLFLESGKFVTLFTIEKKISEELIDIIFYKTNCYILVKEKMYSLSKYVIRAN